MNSLSFDSIFCLGTYLLKKLNNLQFIEIYGYKKVEFN
jgi:hypothetical protein